MNRNYDAALMQSIKTHNRSTNELLATINASSDTTATNTTKGFTSTLNTTTTPLNNGITWTGTGEQNDYPDVLAVCKSDQSGLLYFDFSVDGTNWETFPSTGFAVSAGIQEIHKAIKGGRYFRARFTNNSGVNQSYIRLSTYFGYFGQLTAPLNSVPATDSDSAVTKSILMGTDDAGNLSFVDVDEHGNLKVAVDNPKTAFGELSVAMPEPLAQISFEYGINSQLATSTTTGSGTVAAANSLLSCSTTAAINSSAQLVSRRYLKYRPGQGALARGTAIFTAGAADSKQYAGVGNSSLSDGFFFGYDGTTFGIFYINNGSETHIPQSSWNVDVMDGSGSSSNPSGMDLDPTKGNVWQIKYQYLGFGCIYFYIEHDTDGEFALVHIIRYPNANVVTSVSNPSLNLVWRAANTNNNTDMVVKAGSGALFVEGDRTLLGPKNGIDNNKNTITTLTNIISIKNATTYNTVTNRGQIRIRGVSCAYDSGNGIATLQLILNTTVGGVPAFTPISGSTANNGTTITSGQSIASYDIAGTTISGGTILFNTTVPRNYGQYINLADLDIFINPGDILTCAMKASVSGSCGVAINWVEDI